MKGGAQKISSCPVHIYGWRRGNGKRGAVTQPQLLGALSSDSTGELDVLGHDRHPLGVNRAQVGVLEKTHQVRLGRFLNNES